MKQIEKIIMTAVLLCLSIGMEAQRPAFYKMSPLVREACIRAASLQHRSVRRMVKAMRQTTMTAFVKADDRSALDGCKILAKYGNLYVASIPIDRLGWLSRQKSVVRIEAGNRAMAQMDTTRLVVCADLANDGINLPQSYTGKGVVVGIQDIGFDLTHPNFWSADMSRYRIKAMWDQLSKDTLNSNLPVGRDYTDSLSLLTLGRPRDGDTQTHGTHTAGIAAGSGSEGLRHQNIASPSLKGRVGVGSSFPGIAPDADLCFVCNATSDDNALIDSTEWYKYTYATDALGFKYIFDYAQKMGKPCVINFSEGSLQDFRGDDMLYYEMLDSLTGPGRIIVASAGNEGGKTNYVYKPQGEKTVVIKATSSWHSKTLSFTTRADDDYEMAMLYKGRQRMISLDSIVNAKDSTLHDSVMIGNTKLHIVASAYQDCYDEDKTVTDWVVTSSAYIYPDSIQLALTGNNATLELYPVSCLLGNGGDDSHSILSPGSAPSVICVGSTSWRKGFVNWQGNYEDYDRGSDGVRTPSSSAGPTFDGRIKPDVMAPGANIISSYSSYYEEHNPDAIDIYSDVRRFTYNGRTYAWNANSGTSMSSPVVAGVIALWLQANPRLTPEQCMDVIAETSTHYDESITYPNNYYGYGQIDAAAGLRMIIEQTSGIKNIKTKSECDGSIYSLDGRYMGKNTKVLPKGIYIINNRKVAL